VVRAFKHSPRFKKSYYKSLNAHAHAPAACKETAESLEALSELTGASQIISSRTFSYSIVRYNPCRQSLPYKIHQLYAETDTQLANDLYRLPHDVILPHPTTPCSRHTISPYINRHRPRQHPILPRPYHNRSIPPPRCDLHILRPYRKHIPHNRWTRTPPTSACRSRTSRRIYCCRVSRSRTDAKS